jgi:hypothetical protein
MKNLNEGDLYNTETAIPKQNRSSELDEVQSKIMKEFWSSISRQNISPELAKQIAKQTFGYESNI